MSGEERRQIVMSLLRRGGVVTGAVLSEKLGVTRQVIVADIALLRAAGENIIATPQGYMHAPVVSTRAVRQTIASKHTPDIASLREELYLIVRHGVTVLDVTVEHPLYGEITGNLRLMSERDVDVFLEKMQSSQAEPLSVLTGGLHLHTLEAPDQETLQTLLNQLQKRGFLALD
ncbi:MAG: transcription repressor NadR [Firmicutes bacterium]|nr:transcription repressor NadR [Bacillota bacterium]MBS4053420.1 transcription repressor NadR [Thermaerobacter sp.]